MLYSGVQPPQPLPFKGERRKSTQIESIELQDSGGKSPHRVNSKGEKHKSKLEQLEEQLQQLKSHDQGQRSRSKAESDIPFKLERLHVDGVEYVTSESLSKYELLDGCRFSIESDTNQDMEISQMQFCQVSSDDPVTSVQLWEEKTKKHSGVSIAKSEKHLFKSKRSDFITYSLHTVTYDPPFRFSTKGSCQLKIQYKKADGNQAYWIPVLRGARDQSFNMTGGQCTVTMMGEQWYFLTGLKMRFVQQSD